MKNFAYIPILTLVAAAALSGETIFEEADMKPNGRLEVSNVAGSVEITGWSRKKIEVTGELDDDSILKFDIDGDTARIEVELESQSRKKRYGRGGTDLVIRIPHSTRVSATTVSADLTVKEMKGTQRLRTVSGDLLTDITDQDAVVKSVSGEIEISGDNKRSQLMVATVSGDIDVVNVAGEVDVKSVSGDVDLAGTDFRRLQMESVSGDVDLRGNLEQGGRIDAESVSGDIQLRLDSLYNTEFMLETFSGDIEPILDFESVRTSKYAPGRKLEMVEGDGESRIRVQTMSGDIDITAVNEGRRKPDIRQQTSSRHGEESDGDFELAIEELVLEMEELGRHAEDRAASDLDDLDIEIDF